MKESDLNNQIEDDIKRQISEHYKPKPSKVWRCGAKNKKDRFCIRVEKTKGNQKRKYVPIESFAFTTKQL